MYNPQNRRKFSQTQFGFSSRVYIHLSWSHVIFKCPRILLFTLAVLMFDIGHADPMTDGLNSPAPQINQLHNEALSVFLKAEQEAIEQSDLRRSMFTAKQKVPAKVLSGLRAGRAQDIIVQFDGKTIQQEEQLMRSHGALTKGEEKTILGMKSQRYSKLKENVVYELFGTAQGQQEISILRDYSHLPMMFIRVYTTAAMEKLIGHPSVLQIYENEVRQPFLQQSLPLIDQPTANDAGFSGSGTSVVIIDSGIDYHRPAFGNCANGPGSSGCKVLKSFDSAPEDYSLDTGSYHGTNVSGIVVGVAPATKLIVFDGYTEGVGFVDSDVIYGINWAIANQFNYNIASINMSLGGGAYTARCSGNLYETPISQARDVGISVVVATGNEGYKDKIASPACTPYAVRIGAVYDDYLDTMFWNACYDIYPSPDQVTCFSNSANFLTLLAPGSRITAAGIDISGTSQASPHVAGAVAVLKSAFPSDSLDQILERMLTTGIAITDFANFITTPRLDLMAALAGANSSKLLSVSKAGSGSGTVTSSLAGIDCGADCSESYTSGTSVTLTAIPDNGSTFSGWSGACSGTGSCVIPMTADQNVTATFVIISPPIPLGEAVDNKGLVWSSSGNKPWNGQTAVSFSGGDAARSGQITHNQASNLDTVVTGPGTLTFYWKVSSEKKYDKLIFLLDQAEQYYIDGEEDWQQKTVTIPSGQHTLRWSYTKDITLDSGSDIGLVDLVVFTPSPPNYALNVSKAGSGSGTVTSSPAGIDCGADCSENYNIGTSVTLTAIPDNGSIFSGWSGACSGTSQCVVPMSSVKNVVATFNIAKKADFIVTGITLNPISPTVNSAFSVKVKIKNQGNATGNGRQLGVWKNRATITACKATANKYVWVGNLPAGASKTVTVTGLVVGSKGSKTLRAFVDSNCGTSESNEDNNQAIKTYTVK